jgi:urocanate hydratase
LGKERFMIMRMSAQTFLLVVLILSCTVSVYAQGELWNELNDKVLMLYQQGRYSEATKIAEEALTVAEKTFGRNHPQVATVCENMAELCRQIGKEDEAGRLEARARRIRSNQ